MQSPFITRNMKKVFLIALVAILAMWSFDDEIHIIPTVIFIQASSFSA